jgi:hypothetical protein
MCNETITNPKNENLALQDEIKCLNTYASLNELASFVASYQNFYATYVLIKNKFSRIVPNYKQRASYHAQ